MGKVTKLLPKLRRAGQLQIRSNIQGMHTFELRPVENGFELRGGQLSQPMVFRDIEPRPAVHFVGFLSQKDGSMLRIRNAKDEVVHVRYFEPVIPLRGSVGGLHGPRMIA